MTNEQLLLLICSALSEIQFGMEDAIRGTLADDDGKRVDLLGSLSDITKECFDKHRRILMPGPQDEPLVFLENI